MDRQKIPVSDILQGLGGKDNIAQAAHCATRLRITTNDKGKIDEPALRAIPGVLGIVNSGAQTQLIIGGEVNNVYKEFLELYGANEAEATKGHPLKEELKNKKGSTLTCFFETVAAIFNPIVPALAGCGFLSAGVSIFMALGFSAADPTFNTVIAVSMAIFTFLPFLLSSSAAYVFKMNQFVAMTICAGMMSTTWIGLLAKGVTGYSFLGIPFRVVDYSSSVLPIVFAILLASYIERFLDKHIPGALKIILVPALTVLVATSATLTVVGPFMYWVGEGLASGVNLLFEFGGAFAGLVYGGIYSFMVLLGIHQGMTPVLTQMLSSQGFNYISPASGAANIGQAGAAFGVWLKTKDKTLKGNAGSACLAACTGITEPVIYGVNVPQRKPFLFAAIGGAVGGAFAATFHLKSFVMGGPSFLSFGMFLGGSNPVYNLAMVMAGFVIAFFVAATLTYLFWKPEPNQAA